MPREGKTWAMILVILAVVIIATLFAGAVLVDGWFRRAYLTP